MKKVFSIFMVAFVTMMMASCGSSGDVSKSEANSQTIENVGSDKVGLDDATESNYAALLKEHFGIDAKDIEEDGFKIISVSGSDYTSGFKLTLTYSTKDDDTADFQNAYKAKLFDVTKKVGTANYKTDDLGYISSETIEDYSALNSASYDVGKWYYKYNNNEISVNVTAGSSVWIQLIGNRK
jgi:hypothetical protein